MVANLTDKYRVGVVKVGVSGTRIELWDKNAFRDYFLALPPADAWKIRIANEYEGNPYEYLVKLARIAQHRQRGRRAGDLADAGDAIVGHQLDDRAQCIGRVQAGGVEQGRIADRDRRDPHLDDLHRVT